MEGKRIAIIDKDGDKLLDVVESTSTPGVFGIVALNPDGSSVTGGGGGGGTWGSITGTLSNQTDLQNALNAKVTANAGITGATKTKITYDAKGLVTGGADATTADIADSTDKRYVTDAEKALLAEPLVSEDGAATLTNKIIDSYTNNVHANATHMRVKATVALAKGDPVKYVGFNSGEDAFEVAHRSDYVSPIIGIMDEPLAVGEFGMMIMQGLITGLNISAPEHTVLYPDNAGGYSTTPYVSATSFTPPIAYVTRSHAVHGTIMVNVGAPWTPAAYSGYSPVGSLTSTNVSGALGELDSRVTDIFSPWYTGGVPVAGEIVRTSGRAFSVTSVFVYLTDALPIGGPIEIVVKKNGTSILSANLAITTTEPATNLVYSVQTGDTGNATVTTNSFSAKDRLTVEVVAGTGNTFLGAGLGVRVFGKIS